MDWQIGTRLAMNWGVGRGSDGLASDWGRIGRGSDGLASDWGRIGRESVFG